MSDKSNDTAVKQQRPRYVTMATSISTGAAIGAPFGLAVDNIGIGNAIDVSIGVTIGVDRDMKLR